MDHLYWESKSQRQNDYLMTEINSYGIGLVLFANSLVYKHIDLVFSINPSNFRIPLFDLVIPFLSLDSLISN